MTPRYQITAIDPRGAIVRRFETDETGALNTARRAFLATTRMEESSADLAAMKLIDRLKTAASADIIAPSGAWVDIREVQS
jgi:hypothetical protein